MVLSRLKYWLVVQSASHLLFAQSLYFEQSFLHKVFNRFFSFYNSYFLYHYEQAHNQVPHMSAQH